MSAARSRRTEHYHLPSVHVRRENGLGYDYQEDFYLDEGALHRVVQIALVINDEPLLIRETRDVLCREEVEQFAPLLPALMIEGDPDAEAVMQERAEIEYQRQLRIYAGQENACHGCGCSETRACSGGCVWATNTTCSRCLL